MTARGISEEYDVCMLTSRHPAKDHRVFYKETQTLIDKLGLDVCILFINDKKNSVEKGKNYTIKGVKGNQRQVLGSIIKIKRALKHTDAKVFHIHDVELLILIPYLKWMKKAKIIYDVHEDYSYMMREIIKVPKVIVFVANMYERLFSRMSNKVVLVIDHHIKKFLKYGVRRKNVAVVKNFASRKQFEKFSTKKKKYDFVYSGTTNKTRYLKEFVDFVAEKQPKTKSLLILSGREEERKELKEYIKKKKAHKNINVLEKIAFDKIPQYVSQAKIGIVFTTKNKTYKIGITTKLIEYAACGVPAISTDGNLFRKKFIQENNCGELIGEPTPENIEKAYQKILKNYKKYSMNAKEASKKYCWEKEEQHLIKVYKELLKEK